MTDTVVQPTAPPAPPANAAEARTRLDGLIKDREFGAKLLSGDANANREFSELQAKADSIDPADQVAVAMSGNIGEMPDSSVKLMANMAGLFRELGIREEVIKQTLEDHQVTQQEHDVVAKWKADRLKNSEWVKKWLSGESVQAREMMLANIVLSSNVKGGPF
jgi:hypothetical protein